MNSTASVPLAKEHSNTFQRSWWWSLHMWYWHSNKVDCEPGVAICKVVEWSVNSRNIDNVRPIDSMFSSPWWPLAFRKKVRGPSCYSRTPASSTFTVEALKLGKKQASKLNVLFSTGHEHPEKCLCSPNKAGGSFRRNSVPWSPHNLQLYMHALWIWINSVLMMKIKHEVMRIASAVCKYRECCSPLFAISTASENIHTETLSFDRNLVFSVVRQWHGCWLPSTRQARCHASL